MGRTQGRRAEGFGIWEGSGFGRTGRPSSRQATKDISLHWICCTFLSCSCTAKLLLLPPTLALPQVTTDPPQRIAAQAEPLACTATTLWALGASGF